ncbi:hypothetical protein DCAR_0313411 [Daucus carota subsp. sativus]|uniref:Uncharacterized protein n=1 Tax=Daucus carota subsp. sativus TaxID=79200 RepID=A0AAF0WT75_DAUCS|nr:hypothetical protein DCAR_0313411 [Daucus carota subsp. sativus]
MGKAEKKTEELDVKDVHLKLLDDLVNVNSLLTIAVFVGLSLATPDIKSLDSRHECRAGPREAKKLVLSEVIAFSCFLLSSIVAKVLKLHLYLDGVGSYAFTRPHLDLKEFMLALSACASVAGIVSVSLSIVYIIEIRHCCKSSILDLLYLEKYNHQMFSKILPPLFTFKSFTVLGEILLSTKRKTCYLSTNDLEV